MPGQVRLLFLLLLLLLVLLLLLLLLLLRRRLLLRKPHTHDPEPRVYWYACSRQDVPLLKDAVGHCNMHMYSQVASNEAIIFTVYHLWLFCLLLLSFCNAVVAMTSSCVWLCCNGQSMFGQRQALDITRRILSKLWALLKPKPAGPIAGPVRPTKI